MNQWLTLLYIAVLFAVIACVYYLGKADGRDEERRKHD